MATVLNPYIAFKDNAREAMSFYKDVFGGELRVSTFGDFGNSEVPDLVMHSQLETPSGYTLMASDTPPGMTFSPGSQISISLSGSDEEELRGYFDRLSEGGEVTMPLEKQMWGDLFGMVTDRFGVAWMVDALAE